MILTTYADRIALIASLADKYNARARMRNNVKASSAAARKARKKTVSSEHDGENINHYTDASKYAAKHYGEVYRDTTRFDDDWGDY